MERVDDHIQGRSIEDALGDNKTMADRERLVEIKLIIRDNYEVPALLKNGDPKVNEEVLSLGSSMYNEKQLLLLNRTDASRAEQFAKDYNVKVMQLSERHSTEVDKLTAENKALTMSLQSLRDKLALTSADLISQGFENASREHTKRYDALKQQQSTQIEEKESRHKEMKDTLGKRIEQLEKELRESQRTASLIEKCNQRLEKVLGVSQVIGQFGETKLEEFIRDKFTGVELIKTANQTAMADMKMNLGRLRLMIESKNVTTMQKEDIAKFRRDIDHMVSRKEINAALLISWKDTNLFDGRKHFVSLYQNGIPVIYISNADEHPELIRISIQMLLSLAEYGMTVREDDAINPMDEKSKYVLAMVEALYADYVQFDANLREDRKILSSMQTLIKQREAAVDSMKRKFDDALSQYPDIKFQSAGESISIAKPRVKRKCESDLN